MSRREAEGMDVGEWLDTHPRVHARRIVAEALRERLDRADE